MNLSKRHQLAQDQPVVDHLGGRGGGKALHLADKDSCHHQHGGQIYTQSRFKEEWFEERCSIGDHHEEEGREVSGHHLTHDLSFNCDCHTDPFCWVTCIDKDIISDTEKCHIW